jgi:tetratricopeptide (TPR) repeat protein
MGDLLIDGSFQPQKRNTGKRCWEVRTPVRHTKLANALLLQQNCPRSASDRSQLTHRLGLVLRAQQNGRRHLRISRALRLDPDFIDAHNGLAITLRVSDGPRGHRRVPRDRPHRSDSAIGYYNLSYALDIEKDEESAAALREVVRINPDHYNARYNLGELFRLEGKFDEAAKQFREYVRLAPETQQTRRNIERAKNFIKTFENQ